MTKLHNVMGGIDYITSTVKQENLYAIYATQPLRSFWKDLEKCNREEFAKGGTIGKCIEARELIIALPEGLYHYEHDYLIKHFAMDFKKKYGVDCYARKRYWMKVITSVKAVRLSEKVLDVMPGANTLGETDKQSYDKKQKTKAKVIVTGVLHPKMSPLASKYVQFKNIHKELQRQNEAIFGLERNRGNLEIELADCKGAFKSGKRTELQKQIDELDRMVDNMKRKLSSIVQEYGNWEKKQSGKSEDSSRINKAIENAQRMTNEQKISKCTNSREAGRER